MKTKKPKWRKIFDLEYPDYGHGRISVYEDWISYQDIGFYPKHYKSMLKEQEDKVEALKIAYVKWLKEFDNKH